MSQQPEQNKTAENNIDSVLLSSFPNQGTRFDSINDVISELGEFGYECVTEAMRKYASQQIASLQKQVEEKEEKLFQSLVFISDQGVQLGDLQKQVEELREEKQKLLKLSHHKEAYYNERIAHLEEALHGLVQYWEWSIGDPHFNEYINAKKALNPQDNQL